MTTKKKHRWVRALAPTFVLRCRDCDQSWEPYQFEPTNACVPAPSPDKAIAA